MADTKSVAIITGASQGIGRATALRLARDFSVVVLVARDEENLEKTAADARPLGAEAMTLALDLRQPQSAKTIIEGTLERFGRIDALLNIAGAVPQIDLFQMTDAQWDDGMALKFHGARRLTIQAWGALQEVCGVDVRKRSLRPQARLCRSRDDQRSHQRISQGIRRTGNQRRSAGQQRISWSSDDRAPASLL
jgi:NAD(P)-dependent dehydrogenase (short-subunit alcohol dehydrogenase family)